MLQFGYSSLAKLALPSCGWYLTGAMLLRPSWQPQRKPAPGGRIALHHNGAVWTIGSGLTTYTAATSAPSST
jgi:hypothetical protein